jgi:hypothetical protein
MISWFGRLMSEYFLDYIYSDFIINKSIYELFDKYIKVFIIIKLAILVSIK